MRVLVAQEGVTVSPVTEAITAAVARSGGRALGGAAVFVPLLERFRTETTLQARPRFTHEQLSMLAMLSEPSRQCCMRCCLPTP